MTNNQQNYSNDSKKLNIRMDEETNSKLDQLCEKSGDTKSNVVRALILQGKVNVITNGSQLVKCITKFNNTINQHNLQLSSEIQNVQADIKQIEQMLLQDGAINPIMLIYLAKAEAFIEQLSRKYQDEIYQICQHVKNWRQI